MSFEELKRCISKIYSIELEQPFKNDNISTVFRHNRNNKWFVLMMKIPKSRLGANSDNTVGIINLKCDQ